MLEKITNYFTGKDVNSYYNKLIEQHPEKKEQLREEQRKIIRYSRTIPNIADLPGIAFSAYGILNLDFVGIMCGVCFLGVVEGVRQINRETFEINQRGHMYLSLDEAIERNKRAFDEFDRIVASKPKNS